ncbi:extracellular metalloprotease [Rhizocola hellebori]|uniref:Serine protease n=1 Tax=Rhizocola hellebori TaxID=1392758 RepID=A0A8J3Q6G0_9ACTN|nr:trypsin-like serine protease [Rhizocola hellebori]GIH04025.1 extracellular metalloprotease [Rhizocola hellebori]
MFRHAARAAFTVVFAATSAMVATAPAQAAPSAGIDPATAVSDTGVTADPAVLASRIDATLVKAVAPAQHRQPDGADHTAAAKVEGTIQPFVGVQDIVGGTDERYQTTPANWWPASSTVAITRTTGGVTRGHCTGWMIGDDTLVTAGHCVYPRNGTDWYNRAEFTVWPGRDGGSTPFGSCTVASLHSVSGWTSSFMNGWDYGAMKLNCTVGVNTGTFGFMWTSASQNGTSTYNRGYSGDKPFGTQWASFDSIRVTQDRELFYQHDTAGGNSGGPVYTYSNPNCGGPCGVAVHAHGFHGSGAPNNNHNSGPRIVEPVFNNFIFWRDL